MKCLLLGGACAMLVAQAPPLTFDQIQAKARIAPFLLQTDQLLSERRRDLAGTSGLLREGPTVGLTTGSRRSSTEPTATDSGVEVDLPLFLAPGVRRTLTEALRQADPILKGAALAEARLELRKAYLDAWLNQALARLKEEDLTTARVWLKAAQARLEAGADPAFQVQLVEGEILKAQLEWADAQANAATAWGVLRGLADLPAVPQPLAPPGEAVLPDEATLASTFAQSYVRRAIQSRRTLDSSANRHKEALELSRWSLRGSHEKEGPERVSRLGLSYRFGRPGETAAIKRQTETAEQAGQREMTQALAELDARFQAASQRLAVSRGPAPDLDTTASLNAITLRLEAGKERPSEALPIRRQLLETQATHLRRLHALHLLQSELQALTEGGAR